MTLSIRYLIVTLGIMTLGIRIECHCNEFQYYECRIFLTIMLSVFILCIIMFIVMLNVVMPSVVMLSVVMPSVFMLSVVMLNVVMLSSLC
jgi:hypothetical protein